MSQSFTNIPPNKSINSSIHATIIDQYIYNSFNKLASFAEIKAEAIKLFNTLSSIDALLKLRETFNNDPQLSQVIKHLKDKGQI